MLPKLGGAKEQELRIMQLPREVLHHWGEAGRFQAGPPRSDGGLCRA